jgi:hypothetical protein
MKHHISLTMLLVGAMSQAQITSIDQISVGLANAPADGRVTSAMMSGDGKVIAFSSLASNLTGPSDPYLRNPEGGIFVYTRPDGQVTRISDGTGHAILGAISPDGRFITYTQQDRPLLYDFRTSRCYRYDRLNNTRLLISIPPKGATANGMASGISDDGNIEYLGMYTNADTFNSYIRDILAGKTQYFATTDQGRPIPESNRYYLHATGDGKYVFYFANDPRLPKGPNSWSTYRKRVADGMVELIDSSGSPIISMSRDGRVAAIGGFHECDFQYDVVDFSQNTRFRMSSESAPQITADGTGLLALTGPSTNRVPTRFDFATKKWTSFAVETEASSVGSANRSGTEIIVPSLKSSSGDYEVTVIDLAGNKLTFPKAVAEGGANKPVVAASTSSDGRVVAFSSQATNLVSGITGGSSQVYVRNRDSKITILGSQASDGQPVRGDVQALGISPSGRFLAYGVSTLADFSSGRIVVRDLLVNKDIGSVATDKLTERITVKNDGRIAYTLISSGPNVTRSLFYFDPSSATKVNIGLDSDGKPWTDLTGQIWVSETGHRVYFLRSGKDSHNRLMEWVPGQATSKEVFKTSITNPVHDLSSDGYSVLISGFDRKIVDNNFASDGYQVQNWKRKTKSHVAYMFALTDQQAKLSADGKWIQTFGSVFDLVNKRGWLTAGLPDLVVGISKPVSITNSGVPIAIIDKASLTDSIDPALTCAGVNSQLGALNLGKSNEVETFLNFGNRQYVERAVFGDHSVDFHANSHSWHTKFEAMKYQYRVNGGAWSAAGSSYFDFYPTVDGVYTVDCRAVDGKGNVDTTPSTFTYRRDSVGLVLKSDIAIDKKSVRISLSTTEPCQWTVVIRTKSIGEVERFQTQRYDKAFEVRSGQLDPDRDYQYEVIGRAITRQVKKSGTFRTKK